MHEGMLLARGTLLPFCQECVCSKLATFYYFYGRQSYYIFLEHVRILLR
jgi:hypothetical protein